MEFCVKKSSCSVIVVMPDVFCFFIGNFYSLANTVQKKDHKFTRKTGEGLNLQE